MVTMPGTSSLFGDEPHRANAPEHANKDAAKGTDALDFPSHIQDKNQLFYIEGQGVYRYLGDGKATELVSIKDAPGGNSAQTRQKREEQLNRLTLLVRMRDLYHQIKDIETTHTDDALTAMGADNPLPAIKDKLSEIYDSFVTAFGPINKQNLVKTGQIKSDGSRAEIYTRPNMRQFRKDKDAERVAALEIFDPETNTAQKAPIFTQRFFEAKSQPRSQAIISDAYLQSLSDLNRIDFDHIQELLIPQHVTHDQIEHHLTQTGEIFFDPDQKSYAPRALYLSGDVRTKLKTAEKAARKNPEKFADNIQALQSALPADIPIDAIDFALGDPWIPPQMLQKFAADTLYLDKLKLQYHAHIHSWSLSGGVYNKNKPALHSNFETEYFDPQSILEHILNHQDFRISKRKDAYGSPIHKEMEISLANKKADDMRQAFIDWVHDDPDRQANLTTAYNQKFNSFMPFQSDGAHLTYPGKSVQYTPYKHQSDFIWRTMQTGNVLGAQAVGSGKTLEAVLSVLKLRQIDAIEKALIVVPNNLLAQFSGEMVRAYPEADILILDDKYQADDKDTSANEKLKDFANLARNGHYDAVFMSQSSYDRYQADPVFILQQKLTHLQKVEQLQDRISSDHRAYKQAVSQAQADILSFLGHGGLNAKDRQSKWESDFEAILGKPLEAAKGPWAKHLAPLYDGHIDHNLFGDYYLILDEAHNYKNLQIQSQERFLNKAGSSRANGLHHKITELQHKQGTHNLSMMTATPISNSPDELYTLMRYFRPDLLDQLDVQHYDAWRHMFHHQENLFEILPEGGSYREKARTLFKNLPVLESLFHSFADVVLDKDLNLNKPNKANGGPQAIVIPRPAYLDNFMDDLIQQGQALRAGKIAKSTLKNEDEANEDDQQAARNMLELLNQMRYATLHPELAGLNVDGTLQGKIETASQKIADLYHQHKDDIYTDPKTGDSDPITGALQMVMCDLGVPKDDGSFSAYEELKNQLVAQGVPASKIAFIHDAQTDEQKDRLFAAARSGDIAVLIGTTDKLGTGTNVQKRLKALHNLDLPWRPDQWIQRAGRVDRPGNWNDEIAIYDYVMEKSADLYIAQLLEVKARFVSQIMRGDQSDPLIDYFSQIRTQAASDPEFVQLQALQSEFTDIQQRRDILDYERHKYNGEAQILKAHIESQYNILDTAEEFADQMALKHSKFYPLRPEGEPCQNAAEAGHKVRNILLDLREQSRQTPDNPIIANIGTLYDVPLKAQIIATQTNGNPDNEKPTKNTWSYDIKIAVQNLPQTAFSLTGADLKRSQEEKSLTKKFTEANASLAEIFAAVTAQQADQFTKLAEAITAPYQNIDQTIKELRTDITQAQEKMHHFARKACAKFDEEDRYQQVKNDLEKLKNQMETTHPFDVSNTPS